MSDLIDTTEMYLRTILDLEEEGIVPLRARIAERLGQSGPTVSQTVARMERDGLLTVTAERRIELSEVGRERAVQVLRKHRLAERLLTDVIGVDWDRAHDEACRWEHVISEDVEKRLVALLGDPLTSPYGNPIPGLADLGATVPTRAAEVVDQPLPRWLSGESARLRVHRIGENLQVGSTLLTALHSAGIAPGVEVRATEHGDRIHLDGPGGECELARDDAEQIFVVAADHA